MFLRKKKPKERLLRMMPKRSVCAEIGVWKGEFSRNILKIIRPQELHLVDPWTFQPEFPQRRYGGTAAANQEEMDKIFLAVSEMFAGERGVYIHREYSDKAAQEFADEHFDWIYVDGNHYYEFVKKDLELFCPKVKKDGYITGDDYLWGETYGFPVKKAVDEFLDKGLVEKVSIKDGQFILRKG